MNQNAKEPRLPSRAVLTLLLAAVVAAAPLWPPTASAQDPVDTDTNPPAAPAAPEPAAPPADAPEAPTEPEEPPQAPREVGERVSVGSGLTVREDEAVREAVAVFGSSKVFGKVNRELVTVFGDSTMSGSVAREMVTVFGKAKMTGSVNREMVTVFGDAEVDGEVGREVVTVFGNLKLGPNAKVGRDCIAVLGTVERHPDAELAQEPMSILPMFSGLGEWLTDGLFLGRLIPPGSRIAWIVVGLHLLLYGFVALLLPRPVKACVDQLGTRPLLSFGVGILTLILLTPLYLVLTAIGIGIVLVPFIGLAETVLSILGKTATLEFFGFQLLRGFGRKSEQSPMAGFLIGFVLVTLLYMVPVVGLLLWLLLRPFSLGAAVLACGVAMRRNGNGHAPGIPVPPVQPLMPQSTPPVASPGPAQSSTMGAEAASLASEEQQPPPGPGTPPLDVAVMPRAGFWIRLVATTLDFIALCWILMLPYVDSFFLFFWIAYHIGMWSWKGTTIGGVVCNLKVVRLDGRTADPSVCVVRGLASIFSALPLLLGFFWAGWTADRQSWHDKIAGTVIVRVPKGISLI